MTKTLHIGHVFLSVGIIGRIFTELLPENRNATELHYCCQFSACPKAFDEVRV